MFQLAHRPVVDLHGVATDAGASTRGCAIGPEALRIAGLPEALAELGHVVTDHGDFRSSPVPGGDQRGLAGRRQAEVLALAAKTSAAAADSLAARHIPVFVGGDHSLSMGTVSGVARHCKSAGKDLHVLWIDAHADFNTPGISPTGNLHGMPLALICGEPEFGDAFGGAWRGRVDPRNVTIFAARSIDRDERSLLADRGITVIDTRMIDEIGATALMRQVIAGVGDAHLHVSLDVDAVDPSIAPGAGTPVPGGLTYREAHLVMEMLHDSGRVGSLDIVELNPFLDQAGQSAKLLVGLTASLFGRQIMARAADLTQAPRASSALSARL